MFRTDNTVGMLKTIALIAGLAILLWSLGLPSLRFADAANLASISDTITDSAPSSPADHDIQFTHAVTGVGVANGEDIVLDFSDGPFNLTGIGTEDVSLFVDGADFGQANWSLVNGGTTLTITINTGSIGAGSTTRIYIGNNASNDGGTPDSQIVNPGSEGSYEINISAGAPADTGATRVVVLNSVAVTATVDTIFTFAVSGVNSGVTVNGVATTGTTSTTSIPFGSLDAGVATTAAQQLTVNTNASNGYVVTVQSDTELQSTTGGVIDGFDNGSNSDTPTVWGTPDGDINLPTTWGHWGFTTDDATTTRDAGDEFDSGEFAAISSSTARVVMSHDGPANGSGTGIGTTYVGYRVEITALQEAGDDYSTNLTYIATPTF